MYPILTVLTLLLTVVPGDAGAADAHGRDMIRMMLADEIATLSNQYFMGEMSKQTIFDIDRIQEIADSHTITGLRDLNMDVENNELAAERDYPAGIVTTGKIDRITRTLGRPMTALAITPEPSSYAKTVNAYFKDSSEILLTEMAKGDIITIACEGWDLSLGLALRDCQMVSEKKDSLVDVSRFLQALKSRCSPEDELSEAFVAFGTISHALGAEKASSLVEAIETDRLYQQTARIKTIDNSKWVPALTTATEKNLWKEKQCDALNVI